MNEFSSIPKLLRNWLRNLWSRVALPEEGDGPGMSNRERITIFFTCYLFAIAMWAMVNLGREYDLTLSIPVQFSNIPDKYAQKDEFLKSAEVSVSGEGWVLMNLYNASPQMDISLANESANPRLNLTESAKRILTSYPGVTLLKVEPAVLNINLDKNVTKKVPIESHVQLNFRSQHNFLDTYTLSPDSIVIEGASEIIQNIKSVKTEEINISDVKDNLDFRLSLIQPANFVQLKQESVRYRAKVVEFTEGEIRIFVRTEDLPRNHEVKYNPSVITIRYDVPIEEYAAAQEIVPYSAYAPFAELAKDSTGFVTPIIRNLTPELHLRLRSYQPKRVSYYNVVTKSN